MLWSIGGPGGLNSLPGWETLSQNLQVAVPLVGNHIFQRPLHLLRYMLLTIGRGLARAIGLEQFQARCQIHCPQFFFCRVPVGEAFCNIHRFMDARIRFFG